MEHKLKIHPQYYCRVADGSKTFEIRNNDRGFQPGDTIYLGYFNPEVTYSYTSWHMHYYHEYPPLVFKIGYVLPIDAERVVFSLLKADS